MAHATPGTSFPPNDTYTPAMLEAFRRLLGEGIEVIVFGDIFLEDLRAFRDRLTDLAGLESCYPLWGRNCEELYTEFCHLGFRAVTVCVDGERLTDSHCGQLLTPAFRAALPEGADPCGERGEYHSFAFDGPLFRRPVPYRLGGLHRQGPFVFQELYPGDETPLAAGAAGQGQRHLDRAL
jgi:diphthamide synthase (EF-2-diphthine--ammonia ligase)